MQIDENLPGYIQPKTTLEKLMVMISLLKYKRRKTYAELASIMEKSERQVRRDIKMLERFYLLDYDEYGRPFILTEINEDEMVVNLTTEEMSFLTGLVKKTRSKFKEGLLKKLDLNFQINFDNQNDLAQKVDDLESAINSKNRVILEGYSSANSKTIRDIEVEPITITEFKYLTAFDVKDEKIKVFALDRIEKVKAFEEPFSFSEYHQHIKPDPFGIASGESFIVDILMTSRAYLLMREEFPRSKTFLSKSDNLDYPWRFYGTVHGLQGIGRFVMGLSDDTEVDKSSQLGAYISEKINKMK